MAFGWSPEHQDSHLTLPLDEYLAREGVDGSNAEVPAPRAGFLQQTASAKAKDQAVIDKAGQRIESFESASELSNCGYSKATGIKCLLCA